MISEVKYIPLRVRREYFDAIKSGKKPEEYRKCNDYWFKMLAIKRQEGQRERIGVFICGKDVHRRWIQEVHQIRTPDWFSEQGKMDVDTPGCFKLKLGAEARRPRVCPECKSDDIGQLIAISSTSHEEYEKFGGRWYCVTCGWTENGDKY